MGVDSVLEWLRVEEDIRSLASHVDYGCIAEFELGCEVFVHVLR
jgi:hypothetical protein